MKNSTFSEVGGFSFDIDESSRAIEYNEIEERVSVKEEYPLSKIR